MRSFQRTNEEHRPINITLNYTKYAPGSVLIEFGDTKVLCTASISKKVPSFIRDNKMEHGWLTAEYSMLPSATHTRSDREGRKGSISGRTQEIQRLIGRVLRNSVDLFAMPEYTINIDCDVIQADGGTRTTAINGAVIALYQTCDYMVKQGLVTTNPFKKFIAAISCGVHENTILCDLDYQEDSSIGADCNVVMSELDELIEFQLSSEKQTCTKQELDKVFEVSQSAIRNIINFQKEVLGL